MNLLYPLLFLVSISSYAYILMTADKGRAKKNKWRIPENRLLLVGALYGSLGIWLAMLPPVNHKKSKFSFILKMTLITISQGIILYYIYSFTDMHFYFETAPLYKIFSF